eukprot:TRINITY_DN12526_c0_g1_i1.p1 TRINITY_DN12526_c0_g1~~TRINITY_DN12526_c0_g1_i1.p1  ORF type:complete len:189 (+),score=53.80 TRINITY_DN12526_c0_g1_i1:514-1080(+)
MGDGSAKNRKLTLESNSAFVTKLVASLSKSVKGKVWVMCCEPGTRQYLATSIKGGKAELIDMPSTAKNFPPAAAGDVHVIVTPGDISQWRLARDMGKVAPVVVCNGLFANGYEAFTPVYYFKPISGWGFLLKSYPADWTVFLAGTEEVLPCQVDMMGAGELLRPNLGKVSSLLQSEWGKREAAKRQKS